MNMNPQPHQQRVITERNELLEKILRLAAFIEKGGVFYSLPAAEQDRLRRQLGHMKGYIAVLDERIEVF